MKQYQCLDCDHMYDENNKPHDSICKRQDCSGFGLVVEIAGPGGGTGPIRQLGLCVLLMDASGSMEDVAFKDQTFMSKYDPSKPMSKREVITDNAARAIFELESMVNKDEAYILAVKFDHRQAEMFKMTVADLINRYGTPHALAKYLYDELAAMNGGTNINDALNLAKRKTSEFLNGQMYDMGNYEPLNHVQFSPQLNQAIDVPNVRVLIYTDGDQQTEYGPIVNPFKNSQVDYLMGAYFGSQSDYGAENLKKVIGSCPIHNTPQFFVIDTPQKTTTLRGLFRMASGTSGFCPSCITTSQQR
jgi:hypothetical protein